MEAIITNPENGQETKSESVSTIGAINLPMDVRENIQLKADQLKAKHNVKKIFVIIVQGDTSVGEKPYYIAYLRRPNMMQFSQYMSFVQKDIVQANIMLARNIFLDGDKELVDDEELFLFGTMPKLNDVIDARNSSIVKK